MSEQEEQEPSIEEILASIRQIIYDDDEEDSTSASELDEAPQAPVEEPIADEEPSQIEEVDMDIPSDLESEEIADPSKADEDDDSVVELTEMLEEDIEKDTETQEDVVEIDMQESEPEPDIDEEEISEEDFSEDFSSVEEDPVNTQPETALDDSILTDKAEEATYNAFVHLAANTALDRASTLSLEDIVRDELRPMLRAWVDANLPSLVERLVREELDRVARRAVGE